MSSNSSNNKSQHKDLVFFVRVQYRCNSSWQGTIQWLDGKQQVIFRSALELGNLIDNARKQNAGGTKIAKWVDKKSVS